MKKNSLFKRSLSGFLAFLMLMSTLVFANCFTTATAAGAYGMKDPEPFWTYTVCRPNPNNVDDYIKITYPQTIYMDVSEDLSSLGYGFKFTGHYGTDTKYRIAVCGDIWGGTSQKPSAPSKAFTDNFNNYSGTMSKTGGTITSWGADNWSVGGEDNMAYCLVASNDVQAMYTLSGTPKNTGDFTYSSANSDMIGVFQQYEYVWVPAGNRWVTKYTSYNLSPEDVNIDIHLYDKAPLQAAILNAKAYNGAANWNDYAATLENAKVVLAQREVTQAQVETATKALAEFQFKADYRGIETAIQAYNLLNPADYTEASYAAVKTAVEAVVYNLNMSDQAQVDGYAAAINNAMRALVRVADYTSVHAAVDRYKALVLENYVDTSVATAIYESIDYTLDGTQQDIVSGYAIKLNMAIDALVLKDADFTAYNAAVAKAKALNPADYRDFTAVSAALAVDVSGMKIDQQAKIDAQTKAINDAVDALEMLKASYTAVNAAVSKYKRLREIDYTVASFSAAKTAFEAIVYDLPISKQAEVDAMASALNTAMNALQRIANYETVKAAVNRYNAIADFSIYTDESVQAVRNAYSAIVYDLDASKQTVVNGYATALNTAIDNLKIKTNGVKVDGYVGIIDSKDMQTGSRAYKGVTVLLKQGSTEIASAVTDQNGYFTFAEVEAGSYQLVFKGASLLERTINVTIGDTDLTVADQTKMIGLVLGDFTNDGFINYSDCLSFLASINGKVGDGTYDATTDFTGDGFTNYSDYIIFMIMVGLSTEYYTPWVI